MIKVGDQIPEANITVAADSDHQATTSTALFAGKKVVLFALPGAFTPTCSASHLPGYIAAFDEFSNKGVDVVACLSVNDAFVMEAWAKDQNAENITMVADGAGQLTKAMGLEMDTGEFGGLRSSRYAMVIENGVVSQLAIEEPKQFDVSKAESMLAML